MNSVMVEVVGAIVVYCVSIYVFLLYLHKNHFL